MPDNGVTEWLLRALARQVRATREFYASDANPGGIDGTYHHTRSPGGAHTQSWERDVDDWYLGAGNDGKGNELCYSRRPVDALATVVVDGDGG